MATKTSNFPSDQFTPILQWLSTPLPLPCSPALQWYQRGIYRSSSFLQIKLSFQQTLLISQMNQIHVFAGEINLYLPASLAPWPIPSIMPVGPWYLGVLRDIGKLQLQTSTVLPTGNLTNQQWQTQALNSLYDAQSIILRPSDGSVWYILFSKYILKQ